MKILRTEEMRAVDRAAIEELGIPGLVLMENAAIGVVEALTEAYPAARSVAIFCGPGNNGGDGLAVGRHLVGRGYRVLLALAASERGLGGDAARQLEICRRAGIEVVELSSQPAAEAVLGAARDADVVIDALFGTGLARPVEGLFRFLVEGLNRLARPVLAVDLPSGLDASRCEPIGPHVRAELTVSFAAPKIAHVFPPAAEAVGRMVVADLGFPPTLIDRCAGDLSLLEWDEVAAALPRRPAAAHKGDFGHALVVGGSPGKTGAVMMAARAALRTGAGLVTVAAPETVMSSIESASLETMGVALPVAGDGGIGSEAVPRLADELAGKAAWAFGPGLGQAPSTRETAHLLVGLSTAPLVVDADGLNAFAGALELFAERPGETILTPHVGELARLLGIDNRAVVEDRLGWVRKAARAAASIVVLKGHLTLIADHRGGVFVNPTGNPGMATAGSGDVLTGWICGLLAQGVEPLAATQLGVYAHGLAGDLAAAQVGEAALVAGDLLRFEPVALRRLAAAE